MLTSILRLPFDYIPSDEHHTPDRGILVIVRSFATLPFHMYLNKLLSKGEHLMRSYLEILRAPGRLKNTHSSSL